ncbi:MAG: acetylglutamate kinase [Chloroflexi bacterium]|nr:acetylglutamate kinase [Chloroflexota bacterium]
MLVLKIGGNEIDNPAFLAGLAEAISSLRTPVALVHGGGKELTKLQERLGIQARFIEGLRVTDDEGLAVAEMVLSGLINKRLVALFTIAGIDAQGMSGVDRGLLRVERMVSSQGDLGWVGRIVAVRVPVLTDLLQRDIVPVISPISLGVDGHTYNVNADQAAGAIASALEAEALIFVTNVPGVLVQGQVVSKLTVTQVQGYIQDGTISGGMIPKVKAALEAVAAGVDRALITDLAGLSERRGTFVLQYSGDQYPGEGIEVGSPIF